MKPSFLFLLVVGLLVACADGKKSETVAVMGDSLKVDSLMTDSDTVAIDSVPLAADGLFADFIYGYMKSRKRQLERTTFPLSVKVDGKESMVQKEQWQYDKLFSRMDMICLLYQDEKSIGVEKDTAIKKVSVDMFDLKKNYVKQYVFQKPKGQWYLTNINQHALAQNENSDFYKFYRQFASSTKYQKQHIANPFLFTTYDSDNFSTIEGTLDVVQWPDYAPEFPQGMVATINYGQTFPNPNTRVLMLYGVSNGMTCTLVFKKVRGEWMMTKFSN